LVSRFCIRPLDGAFVRRSGHSDRQQPQLSRPYRYGPGYGRLLRSGGRPSDHDRRGRAHR